MMDPNSILELWREGEDIFILYKDGKIIRYEKANLEESGYQSFDNISILGLKLSFKSWSVQWQ